jgi:hypothetical protein
LIQNQHVSLSDRRKETVGVTPVTSAAITDAVMTVIAQTIEPISSLANVIWFET